MTTHSFHTHHHVTLAKLRKMVAAGVVSFLLWSSATNAGAGTVLGVIGDEGSPFDGATRVASMVASKDWQTDYVLTLGDNSGTNYPLGSSQWDDVIGARYGQYMKARSGLGINPYPNQTSSVQRFFPVVGDHDRDSTTGSVAGYLDYFHEDPGAPTGRLPVGAHDPVQSYYDFTLPIEGGTGSIHVFAMDSEAFAYSPESRQDQVVWLRDGLRNSTATWKFVTLHSPPFSSSLHHSNPLYQLPFQQWGAHAVMSGHDHVYERLRISDAGQTDMLYFVNGLAGSNIYPFFGERVSGSEVRFNFDFGAMKILVTDEEAIFEFRAAPSGLGELPAGELIDSLTLLKSSLPIPPAVTADFNADGLVDVADLSIWSSSFGVNGFGDANQDGLTDGNDFLLWQRQLSAFQPNHPPAFSAVPEPSSLAGAIGFIFAFQRWRGQQRHATT